MSDSEFYWPPLPFMECPDRDKHREPQGPNEDVSQCLKCWSLTFELRPEGHTYGEHLPDCSLPIRHEGYCEPGGSGHPPSENVCGYWPEKEGGR